HCSSARSTPRLRHRRARSGPAEESRAEPTQSRENRPMADLLTLADRLFTGAEPVTREKLFAWSGELVEVADDTAFVAAFSNVAALDTADGLVLADTSREVVVVRVTH